MTPPMAIPGVDDLLEIKVSGKIFCFVSILYYSLPVARGGMFPRIANDQLWHIT